MLTIDDHDAIRAAALGVRGEELSSDAALELGGKLRETLNGTYEPVELAHAYLRYEALRKLNAAQYARLSALHLALGTEPHVTFDELVDLLVIGELTV